MNITWASVVWLFWSGAVFVAAGGVIVAWFRARARGLLVGGAMVFGALLMFAFVSAVIGLYEIEDYTRTVAFRKSLIIGSIGAVLFGYGLKKVTSHTL